MTRRLALLRILGLMPVTRYGSMGQAHRRPDQFSDPPPSAVAPTQSAGTLRARTVIIFGTGVNIGLFVYTGTPALGNPPQIAIVPNTTTKDPFGNLIGTSKILMQANTITESGGIFRTAAAAPLIQLDGPHNAFLAYDAASKLRETIAPVATTDGLGNTVQLGFTAYGTVNTIWSQLGAAGINFNQTNDTATQAGLGENADGSVTLTSAPQAATPNLATQSWSSVANTVAAFSTLNAGLVLQEQSPIPAVQSGAGAGPVLFGGVNGFLRYLADSLHGDSNNYVSGRFTPRVASPGVLINSVAFTNIPQVFNVAAQKYRIHAMISLVTTFAAGAANLQVNGSATINNMSIVYWNTVKSSSSSVNATRIQALATVIPSVTFSATEQYIQLDGYVDFSAAGTFAVQMSCTIAADTYTVITDSFVDLMPV